MNTNNNRASGEYMTPDDFEKELGIPKATQAVMRHRKKVPYVQLAPRTPRYRRSDIEKWVADRAVAASNAKL